MFFKLFWDLRNFVHFERSPVLFSYLSILNLYNHCFVCLHTTQRRIIIRFCYNCSFRLQCTAIIKKPSYWATSCAGKARTQTRFHICLETIWNCLKKKFSKIYKVARKCPFQAYFDTWSKHQSLEPMATLTYITYWVPLKPKSDHNLPGKYGIYLLNTSKTATLNKESQSGVSRERTTPT